MTVEITGCTFGKGFVRIYATDCSERHLQMIERNRYDDGDEKELEFVFPRESYNYLYGWLKRQKSVKTAAPKTLGDAVRATLGIVTNISGKYLEFS